MPADEQRARMRSMRSLVQEFNVYRWAGRMLLDAARMRHRQRVLGSRAAESRNVSRARPMQDSLQHTIARCRLCGHAGAGLRARMGDFSSTWTAHCSISPNGRTQCTWIARSGTYSPISRPHDGRALALISGRTVSGDGPPVRTTGCLRPASTGSSAAMRAESFIATRFPTHPCSKPHARWRALAAGSPRAPARGKGLQPSAALPPDAGAWGNCTACEALTGPYANSAPNFEVQCRQVRL